MFLLTLQAAPSSPVWGGERVLFQDNMSILKMSTYLLKCHLALYFAKNVHVCLYVHTYLTD